MKSKTRVLVIEDFPEMRRLIRLALQNERYEVHSAKDGESGLELAGKIRPDLVLLDIGLPGMDGLEVLKALRARGRVPVIMLTSSKKEADCLVGLKLGADDYLSKPISMPELAARIEAVLRRDPSRAQGDEPMAAGALSLDPKTHELLMKGKPLPLAPKEFQILRLLLEARGRVVSRRTLLLEVWGYAEDLGISPRMVDQYVSRIRRKLGREGRGIVTVPTLGYKIKP